MILVNHLVVISARHDNCEFQQSFPHLKSIYILKD